MQTHRQSLFLLIALGVIWGSGYVLAKFATTNGVAPLGYSFWQSIGPALFLSIVVIFKNQYQKMSIKHLKFFLLCGLIGIAIPNTNMYFAAPHLPAGILALLVNTVPIITFVLALIMGLENFDWRALSAVLLGLSGLGLIIIPTASLPLQHQLPWMLATLLSPISFAVCAIFTTKFRPPKIDSLTLAAGMLISSTIVLSPLVVYTNQFHSITNPFNLVDGAIILEILLSSIGYVIFFELIKKAGPIYYSLVSCVVALAGLFWGWLIYQEKITLPIMIAFIFIVTAISIATLWKRQIPYQVRDDNNPSQDD